MIVVTSGTPYVDIDAFGCGVAYAELLRLSGTPAQAVFEATLNESIPSVLRALLPDYTSRYQPNDQDQFVLVDVSDPEHFEPFVDLDRLTGVIDHHPGFEAYWQGKIGAEAANIEFIGAACTQVYELWETAGMVSKMSTTSALLLASGILDNTLNFKAHVSTERDKKAYEVLRRQGSIAEDWPATYFTACQQAIVASIGQAITNDFKQFPEYPAMPHTLGQLVIWDAKPVIAANLAEISEILAAKNREWAINIVSIFEGRSYFFASASAQPKLEALAGVTFAATGIARAGRLWLRKELLKEASADSLRTKNNSPRKG